LIFPKVASIATRVVEGMGNAALKTASFSVIVAVFPGGVATVFAILEAFVGLGFITGPIIGTSLAEWKGYLAPFAVLAALILATALVSLFVLHSSDGQKYVQHVVLVATTEESILRDDAEETENRDQKKPTMFSLIALPLVLVGVLGLFCVAVGFGFVVSGLERHMNDQSYSASTKAYLFGSMALAYAICCPVVGRVCDRGLHPVAVNAVGFVVFIATYTFMGPDTAIIGLLPSLGLQAFSLVLQGLGAALLNVSAFSLFHRQALAHGMDDDLSTYGLVSGLWASTYSLGAFVGPLIGGVMFDWVGFPRATLVYAVVLTLVALAIWTFLLIRRYRTGSFASNGQTSTVAINKTDGDSHEMI